MMNLTFIEHRGIRQVDYFILFLLLGVSGNPLFGHYGGKNVYLLFLLVVLVINSLYSYSFIFNKRIVNWIIASISLFSLQGLVLGMVSLPANVNFLLRILAVYFCTCALGPRFRYTYLRVMTFLALISLFFFVLQTITNSALGLSIPRFKSLLFYNTLISKDGILDRNCGMFWEPGAFQGYLMLVPILFIDNLKLLWQVERRSCIILLIALLTTQSTTGYVVLFVILSLILFKEIKGTIAKIVILFIILFSGLYAFISFEFLGEKMIEQFQNAQELQSGEVSWTRMGAMKIDMENIARHPISGNGFLLDSMYGKLGSMMAGSGNGFSGALNAFGIPFMIMYLVGIYKNSSGNGSYQKLVAVLGIVLCLNGEFFLNYPLFWSLLFIENNPNDHLFLSTK